MNKEYMHSATNVLTAGCAWGRSFLLITTLMLSVDAQADSLSAASGHALDTMAPVGHWAARVEIRSNSYDKWYDNSGNLQGLKSEFNGLDLNGLVFSPLTLFGAGATLGTSALRSKATLESTQVILAYGLQDDVTLGFIFPFIKTSNQVDFSVTGGNTGLNPAFNPAVPMGPANFPFAPVGGAVVPLGTAGVKKLISDPTFGYSYAPVGNSSTSGMSDPTAGILWRYFKDERSSALLGVGMRFGVAKGDNPDSLTEIPIGDGSNDLRLRLEYFRDLGHEFDLHLLAEHFEQLADHVTKRVPQPGQLLAAASSKERLRRDLGDYQEYDLELGHRWGNWRASGTGHMYIKGRDKYTSDLGTNTTMLENYTNIKAKQWRAGLSWSGISAWQAGDIPLPLIVKFEVQDTYGGYNFPKVRDYYLQLTSFF
jgi:hypothetical protein